MTLDNDALDFLYEATFRNPDNFDGQIIALIEAPHLIGHTNHFASLLVFLNRPQHISALLKTIRESEPGDIWLLDFLYAAGDLLQRCSGEEDFDLPDGLLEKLGGWLIGYRRELSWKAALILQNCCSPVAEQYLLQKLDMDDFFLVHTSCLTGIMNYDPEKNISVVKKVAADPATHEKVKAHCDWIIKAFHKQCRAMENLS